MKITRILILILVVTSLTACYSLADDITPPPGYVYQTPVPSTAPTEVMYFPFMPPNPEAGAATFTEKCEPCHGPSGFGDGPKAADLPNPVAPIGSLDLARLRTPEDWYRQVTNGNIEKYMPPFNSLTDRQRWDVVAYAFSLSVPDEMLALGGDLYPANCADCHGINGDGKGVDAASLAAAPTAFLDQSVMAERSLNDLILGATHPGVDDLPHFEGELSDDELLALAAYVRSLTFVQDEVVAEEPEIPGTTNSEPEEPAPVETGEEIIVEGERIAAVAGQVVNMSGGDVPADMNVTLYGFDQFQQTLTQTVSLDDQGGFIFNGIEMPEGRAFIVALDYDGATYSSDIAVVEQEYTDLFFQLPIFEKTSDTSQLSIDRLHIFFEFLSADTVRVAELILVTNPTNLVVAAEQEGQPTIEIPLPEGAQNLQFEDDGLGNTFIETENGFGDLRPIQPGTGTHEILFSFDIPYSRNFDLDQTLDMDISALVVMLPDIGVEMSSDMLVSSGMREMAEEGASFELFTGGGLTAGTRLPVSLSGTPKFSEGSGSNSSLLIGASVLGVALVIAGVWMYGRQKNAGEPEVEIEDEPVPEHISAMNAEELMDAIIALDDLYRAGDLPEGAYVKQRNLLKQRLDDIL